MAEGSIDPAFSDRALQDCLSTGKLELLMNSVKFWKDLCDALARYEAPLTLAHYDVCLENLVARHGAPTLHDWGISCISAPLYDIVKLNDDYYWHLICEAPSVEHAEDTVDIECRECHCYY